MSTLHIRLIIFWFRLRYTIKLLSYGHDIKRRHRLARALSTANFYHMLTLLGVN
jgi:hypothetical protein